MDKIWQIGVVVRNLDKAVTAFMEAMNLTERPFTNKVGRSLSEEDCKTIYKADKHSMASCLTCCFSFENIELEFIQPYGDAPSEWKNFLDEHGEGLHHLGFKVQDLEEARKQFLSKGFEEVQSGSWGEGEYHYIDAKEVFGFVVELLKFY